MIADVREQLRAGSFAILAIGVALTLISIFADSLALGLPGSGFGWKQISGTLVGLTLAGLGLWLTARLSK